MHYLLRDFTLNSLSFSRTQYKYNIFSANSLWIYYMLREFNIHYIFRGFTLNLLSIKRIHREFTVSRIQYNYALSISRIYFESTISRFHFECTIFFPKSLFGEFNKRIRYLFREFSLNSVFYSRFHSDFTISIANSI